MKSTIKLLLPVLLIGACVGDTQDIPPGFTEDPLFAAEITLDGESTAFEAGVDGYILDVQHETTDRGVVQYRAHFKKADCAQTPCGPSLEFIFWDSNESASPVSGVESTFQVGEKLFYDLAGDALLDVLVALQEEAALGSVAVWTDGLGEVLGQGTSVTVTAQSDEFIDLCFNTLRDVSGSATGCLSSFCFHMRPDAPCIAWLSADRMIDDHVLVEVEVIGTAPHTYKWMNGETTPFVLMPLYEDRPTGVSVVVSNANECETVIHQTMRLVNGTPEICSGAPGFSVDTFEAAFSQFSTVEVRYTDADGQTYSSAYSDQSASSLFEINLVDDYLDSPGGFPTKQVAGSLESILYSADGSVQLPLEVLNFSLAVSFDE